MGSSSVVSSVQFVCVGAKGQVSGRRASCCFLALGGVLCALLLTGGPLACLCPCWPASKGARLAIFLAYFAPSRCLFTHTKKFPSSGRQPAVALSPGRPIGRPSSPLERTRYTCPSHTHTLTQRLSGGALSGVLWPSNWTPAEAPLSARSISPRGVSKSYTWTIWT